MGLVKGWKRVTMVVGRGLLVAGAAAVVYAACTMRRSPAEHASAKGANGAAGSQPVLIWREGGGLLVPPEIAAGMRLQTATAAACTRPLRLPPLAGVLALDPDRLVRVHCRFAGEVIELGTRGETAAALRVGDGVRKGDLLAVVWSKELGEKKSELVDALVKLRAEEQLLERLQRLYEQGAGPERSVRDAERAVNAARIEVERAERTLRTWRLSEAELAAVRAEAQRLPRGDFQSSASDDWARVEIRAPRDGVIVEKNINVGDSVDPADELFIIGDTEQLVVWVHVYEDDLPLIQSLPAPIPWEISVTSQPERTYPGVLERIGVVIDPVQHTALVSGHVQNSDGRLRAGQFVTATLELPPPEGELELPATAVVEDGRQSLVFVRSGSSPHHYLRTEVAVVRRFRDRVYVRAADSGLRAGDEVVTSGALLLREAWDQAPTAELLAQEQRAADCGPASVRKSKRPVVVQRTSSAGEGRPSAGSARQARASSLQRR